MPIAYLKPVFYVVIYATIFTRSSASTQGLKVIFVSRSTRPSTFRSPFLFCSHLTGGDSNFDFGSLHTSVRWPQQVLTAERGVAMVTWPALNFGIPITLYKKLSYRHGTARCVVSVEILPIVTQQCSVLNQVSDVANWPVRQNRAVGLGSAWRSDL